MNDRDKAKEALDVSLHELQAGVDALIEKLQKRDALDQEELLEALGALSELQLGVIAIRGFAKDNL